MKYTLDATDKKLGRLASEAASILMGKNTPDFQRNKAPQVEVLITNASRIEISEAKRQDKSYKWYSGFPGGLRFERLDRALEKKGIGEVIRKTVYGMLPTNKLRSRMIKNLTITE